MKSKREFITQALVPYFENPELCAVGNDGNCVYWRPDDDRKCVLGKHMKQDFIEKLYEPDSNVGVCPSSGSEDFFANLPDEEFLEEEHRGVLTSKEWRYVQLIHDDLSQGQGWLCRTNIEHLKDFVGELPELDEAFLRWKENRGKSDFIFSQFISYLNGNTKFGYGEKGCTYVTDGDDPAYCVVGQNLKPAIASKMQKGEISKAQGVGDLFDEYGDDSFMIMGSRGFLNRGEWVMMQRLHDCLANFKRFKDPDFRVAEIWTMLSDLHNAVDCGPLKQLELAVSKFIADTRARG